MIALIMWFNAKSSARFYLMYVDKIGKLFSKVWKLSIEFDEIVITLSMFNGQAFRINCC